MRPPPRSTLFPYTTLFRSAVSLPCHLARETPLYSCRCICIIVHIISLQCNSTFPLRGLLTGHKGRHIAKRDLVNLFLRPPRHQMMPAAEKSATSASENPASNRTSLVCCPTLSGKRPALPGVRLNLGAGAG